MADPPADTRFLRSSRKVSTTTTTSTKSIRTRRGNNVDFVNLAEAEEKSNNNEQHRSKQLMKDGWKYYTRICNLFRYKHKYDEVFRKLQLDPVYPYLDSMVGLNDPIPGVGVLGKGVGLIGEIFDEQQGDETTAGFCVEPEDDSKDDLASSTRSTTSTKKLISQEFQGARTQEQIATHLVLQAEKVTPKLTEICRLLARTLGLPFIGIGPVKEEKVAIQKAKRKYNGDLCKVTDYARALIVVDDIPTLLALLEFLRSIPKIAALVRRVKLSTLKSNCPPKLGGYRDCIINMDIEGHICEIQVHLFPMWEVCFSANCPSGNIDGYKHHRYYIEYNLKSINDPFDALEGLSYRVRGQIITLGEESTNHVPLDKLRYYHKTEYNHYFALVGLYLKHGLDMWAEITLKRLIQICAEGEESIMNPPSSSAADDKDAATTESKKKDEPNYSSEIIALYKYLAQALEAQGKVEEAEEANEKIRQAELQYKEDKDQAENTLWQSIVSETELVTEVLDSIVDPNKKERLRQQNLKRHIAASKQKWRTIRKERFSYLEAFRKQQQKRVTIVLPPQDMEINNRDGNDDEATVTCDNTTQSTATISTSSSNNLDPPGIAAKASPTAIANNKQMPPYCNVCRIEAEVMHPCDKCKKVQFCDMCHKSDEQFPEHNCSFESSKTTAGATTTTPTATAITATPTATEVTITITSKDAQQQQIPPYCYVCRLEADDLHLCDRCNKVYFCETCHRWDQIFPEHDCAPTKVAEEHCDGTGMQKGDSMRATAAAVTTITEKLTKFVDDDDEAIVIIQEEHVIIQEERDTTNSQEATEATEAILTKLEENDDDDDDDQDENEDRVEDVGLSETKNDKDGETDKDNVKDKEYEGVQKDADTNGDKNDNKTSNNSNAGVNHYRFQIIDYDRIGESRTTEEDEQVDEEESGEDDEEVVLAAALAEAGIYDDHRHVEAAGGVCDTNKYHCLINQVIEEKPKQKKSKSKKYKMPEPPLRDVVKTKPKKSENREKILMWLEKESKGDDCSVQSTSTTMPWFRNFSSLGSHLQDA